MYIVARSIDQGRLAGVVSVLGIVVGTLFHVAAAALGLSALLVSSALAFSLVKYFGATYLIYLGIRKLMEKDVTPLIPGSDTNTPIRPDKTMLQKAFTQGVIVNLFNPKTALFFLAFLPQFIDPVRGNVAIQTILLGIIFSSLALISDSTYAILAGTLRNWLKGNRRMMVSQRYFTGGIYITLGLVTAFSGSLKKT